MSRVQLSTEPEPQWGGETPKEVSGTPMSALEAARPPKVSRGKALRSLIKRLEKCRALSRTLQHKEGKSGKGSLSSATRIVS